MRHLHSIAAMAVALLALLGAGCKTETNSNEAVRKAVMQYLVTRQNLNMDKMDINVTNVTIKDNVAEADVSFQVKGAPSQSMSMHYTLHRSGDAWAVDKGGSMSGHPSTGATGGTGGGMGGGLGDGQTVAPPQTMPGQLPPGHPAVGKEKPSSPAKQ